MTSVAIVHDYLTQHGGAERVVLNLARAFPDAPIYTSVYDPVRTFEGFRDRTVVTSPLNRVGVLRRDHRVGLPLYGMAFDRLEVDADVVIASSSGWAHGARTEGHKIVYCYNPARWIYQPAEYLSEAPTALRWAMTAATPRLRAWDVRAASTAQRYCAISTVVAERIRRAYGREAEIVPPPPTITPVGPSRRPPVDDGPYFLCVSRLLPYKNVDALLAAFSAAPELRLLVAGTGPDAARLARLAPGNVHLLGRVDDAELRWLYAHCAAVVSASFEDYGLTPLEGATFGRPSVVLRHGGFLDTVVDGRTGLFFDAPSPVQIRRALRRAIEAHWDAATIAEHADRFSEARFAARLQALVAAAASPPSPASPPGPAAPRKESP